jgi:negative regulator of flagellin synthesis FlgM
MIDQIKNKAINTNLSNNKKISENSTKIKAEVQKASNPNQSKIDSYDGKVSQFITKEKIKGMSKEPPIDKASTSRIKEAIQNGNYPLDLSRVTDALFEAYKEMK